jgi:energy-coupling factor transporter ATP-binding protein EcfA2
MMNENDFIDLGRAQGYGGTEFAFGFSSRALGQHIYLIGKTGSGKSSLILNLLAELVRHDRGIALLDPHGDLAEDLLECIPKNRADRLLYFNPSDLSFPIAFNVLAEEEPDRRPRVAAGIVTAFRNIWSDSWGPRLEYILYNAIRALLDAENATILGLPRLLVDPAYRRWIVRQIRDPFIKSFWEDEFESYDHRFRREAIAPIQNKIGQLTADPVLRNTLGQVKRKIDFRSIMDNGGIFIGNLSKGKIGETPSHLLGSLLMSHFQIAAMERAELPQDARREFVLAVDEFHGFVTDAFASILSETRKYRLSLVLSHQFTAQVASPIREAVFGNVGSIVAFRTGASDAELLSGEYGEAFAPGDFLELDPFWALVRPASLDGFERPFRAQLFPPRRAFTGSWDWHIRVSQERYGTPREVAEDKMKRWFDRWNRKRNGLI